MNIAEWGNSTWYLFHTLAYKLKNEYSSEIKTLYRHFFNICGNLPCPDCRQHAVYTLNKMNINKVKSREDFINFILHFHNIVNKRLNKKKFSLEEHNKLYYRAKTANIIGHFIYVMSKNANNSKAMLDTFNRKRKVNDFLKYLNTHQYMFYP